MPATLLGDYLKARRAQVAPETTGLPTVGRRRVPGLRREEVAALAGVSVDYYVRLEQGRERNPSVQVLEALARVLRLDEDARLHLYQVARLTTPRRAPSETVDPELLGLLDAWPHNPALVLGRAYDVLAGNQLAHELFAGFRHGANLVVKVFLDPTARTFYRDWEEAAANTVAGFRVLHGRYPDDPRIAEVLEVVRAGSEDFASLWGRHDARGKQVQIKRFRHPEIGDLTLRMNAFDVRSGTGQEMVVYHAEPGTPDADALRLLGTLAATRAGRPSRPGEV